MLTVGHCTVTHQIDFDSRPMRNRLCKTGAERCCVGSLWCLVRKPLALEFVRFHGIQVSAKDNASRQTNRAPLNFPLFWTSQSGSFSGTLPSALQLLTGKSRNPVSLSVFFSLRSTCKDLGTIRPLLSFYGGASLLHPLFAVGFGSFR